MNQLKIRFGDQANRTHDGLDMGDDREKLRMIHKFWPQQLANGGKTILNMLNLKCLLNIQGEISVGNLIYIYNLHGERYESEIEK